MFSSMNRRDVVTFDVIKSIDYMLRESGYSLIVVDCHSKSINLNVAVILWIHNNSWVDRFDVDNTFVR